MSLGSMRPCDLGYGSQVGSFAAHGGCAPLWACTQPAHPCWMHVDDKYSPRPHDSGGTLQPVYPGLWGFLIDGTFSGKQLIVSREQAF